MTHTVDARGQACPQPVILARQALLEHDAIIVVVDNGTAQTNVTRMAQKMGARVQAATREDGIYLHIERGPQGDQEPRAAQGAQQPSAGPLVLVVPSELMGRGEDPALGRILVRGFFHTLGEIAPLPDIVIFLNSGVRLVVADSPILEDLQTLCSQGVTVLACGTCLGHFGLTDQLAVGEVSNMYAIAEAMLNAGKVIQL